MSILRWLLYFPLQLALSIFCKITTPVACLFVYKEPRTDRVKRLGNQQYTFDREYLRWPFIYWQTHDNACDEYWWGLFTEESYFKFIREATQADYDNSAFIRYFCRCLWVWRNTAYGFAYHIFGCPLTETIRVYESGEEDTVGWYKLTVRKNSFQLKAFVPLGFGFYNNINIGWKSHKGFPRAMFAGRLIGIRKTK